MIVTIAYTGMRWSEAIGLPVECVHDERLDIDWKLYELNGRFYQGPPKDGSMRPADLPPFLAGVLAAELADAPRSCCTCRCTEDPWCPGQSYVFLGPDGGHFRRSSYSERSSGRPPTAGTPREAARPPGPPPRS